MQEMGSIVGNKLTAILAGILISVFSITTISALARMEGVNPKLQFHLNAGMNVGLTEAQVRSLISVLQSRVCKKEADNANEILSKVLSSRAR
jgi:alkylhydroperoxidase/carboxymuconolactone decarboxylase family protein YurZ